MSLYHNGHAPLSPSSCTYSAYSLQCHRGCWALRSAVSSTPNFVTSGKLLSHGASDPPPGPYSCNGSY